jgi:pimeloyl-ACP methyl ester carboxylesterase
MRLLLGIATGLTSCMQFKISDSKATKNFAIRNVQLYTNTVSINGHNVHYAQTGNDSMPTLVLVHGSPGSWKAFTTYLQDADLLQKYRLIAIDRPGFGQSDYGASMPIPTQAQLIHALLQSLHNNKPTYLVGHSLGGPLVLSVAALNSSAYAGIVLLAASVSEVDEPAEKWRGLLLRTGLDKVLPGAIKTSNAEIWLFKNVVKKLAPLFAKVTSKVIIVHGDKDKFVPVANAYYAQKKFVNAVAVSVIILKNAPHFIPWHPWYTDIKKILLQLN